MEYENKSHSLSVHNDKQMLNIAERGKAEKV